MFERQVDRGLGTTYERFAVYNWLESLADRYVFHTILEGPGDGVAGIPGIHSLPLAQRGCQVTVALAEEDELRLARRAWNAQGCLPQAEFVRARGLCSPFDSHSFDLAWNFNRLPFLDPPALVAEMSRVSCRYVALIVPNRHNYGFPARRLYHRRTGLAWPYGDIAVMDPDTVKRLLKDAQLRVLEVRWVDVPWWPDIIDPVEWLRAMIPGAGRLRRASHTRNHNYCWTADTLPYFDPVGHADVHRRMHRLGFLERWGGPRWFFAHHFAILAERNNATV